MPKALEGVKILDLTQFEAGTSCTEYLAFLGADVIKIEPPERGEPGRTSDRSAEEREKGLDAWYFLLLNANKRGITLNLKSEKGVAIFKEMAKKADIVVSNFMPGTMDKLGVGYDVLSKINPGLVYAENSGFGTGGPYSAYASFDAVAKAAGSAFSNTGEPDGPPLSPGPSIGDTGSGIHMAVAILAALHYREKTGQGQAIDMSMADNIINQNRIAFRYTLAFGLPSPRVGAGAPNVAPWDTFKCKGGQANDYVLIAAVQPHQYETLMKLVGREDLLRPELTSDRRTRYANRKEINAAIENWTVNYNKMEAFKTLQEKGIPAAPVLDTKEVMEDPHYNQRGMIVEITHPARGTFKMPGCPVKMSKSPVDYRPAPLLGQHNEEVYAKLFGYSKEEVAKLAAEKVI